MICMFYLNKLKKGIKKVQVYRKESVQRPQTKHLQNLHT